MMSSILKKSNYVALLPAGILFLLLAASPVFADYSGHVASFKSEENAAKFVNQMKAKGHVAYYEKETIPGKGEFYRTYIGRYKTLPLAQKALAKLKKSGEIDYFDIQKTAEKNRDIVEEKTETVARTNEPAQKPESKPETVVQKSEPTRTSENKAETAAQTNEPAQKPEGKSETAVQKSEPARASENRTETIAQKSEPAQKPESKAETVTQKIELAQKSENKTAPSIDTRHYYDGIKGIVLKNGKVIKGQIISVDDKDVLKIRTKKGKILSYSFTREVQEYITEYEPE